MTRDPHPSPIMQATRSFARRSDQIPLVRTFVRDALTSWGDDCPDERVVQDVVLMASELFTNAVVHGEGMVEVSVLLLPSCFRLTVSDQGSGDVPRMAQPADDALSGRGLWIVDRLARAWGSGRDALGRMQVWLEMPRA